MRRLGTLFCLLAVVAIQVPWIVCTGCCEDVTVPAVRAHACHVHESELSHRAHRHDHHHHHDCTCEHGTEDEPEHGNGQTEHYIVQLAAVTAGSPVVLPDHLPTDTIVASSGLLPAATVEVAAASHDPPEASLAVPRGTSEQLLL